MIESSAPDSNAPPRKQVQLPIIPALDGLRGIAILLVLCDRFRFVDGHVEGIANKLFIFITGLGWIGVQLFFVLSGYLITRALLETRDCSNYFGAFYARRILRIFPLYYAMCLMMFVLVPLLFDLDSGARAALHGQIWVWTYLSNWAAPFGHSASALPHFWSLGVEEQFYLLWPAVVLYCSPRRLSLVCIGLALFSLASRYALHRLGVSWAPDAGYEFTVCRMDALAFGALVAILPRLPAIDMWLIRRRNLSGVALLILVAVGASASGEFERLSMRGQTVGFTVLAVGFAGLLWWSLDGASAIARALSWSPLRSVGKFSYAMYIFHSPLHLFVGRPILAALGLDQESGVSANLLYLLIAALVTYLIGALSYLLFERHFLRMKRYFVPQRNASLEDSLLGDAQARG